MRCFKRCERIKIQHIMNVFSFFFDVAHMCNASEKKNENARIVKTSTKNTKKCSKSMSIELLTSFEFISNHEFKMLFNKKLLESKSN